MSLRAMNNRVGLLAAMAAVGLVFLASASSSFAQQATQDAYGGEGIGVLAETGSGGPGASGSPLGDELPFTGMDLGIVALIGVALVGAGFVMRRAAGREPSRSGSATQKL